MKRENMLKVCSFVSLTYLALVLYFLGAIHNWGLFTDLPIKVTRGDVQGHAAGLFGTPVCAVAFLALAWLMQQWNQRLQPDEQNLWNRFPVPFHAEVPSSDPIGRRYRLLFFLLVFGVGAYVQVDLFKNFLQGSVHLDWPTNTVPLTASTTDPPVLQTAATPTPKVDPSSSPICPCHTKNGVSEPKGCRPFEPTPAQIASDPEVLEFGASECGKVISSPMGHFTHRFTSVLTNDYHFDQNDGLTYFPGTQAYLYLLITMAMAISWLASIGPWLIAPFRK